MESKSLKKIGFTSNESKIYLILLKESPLYAGEISKKTQINRRTTYDTLERLIKKGYVIYTNISNKRTFNAINPEMIIEKIKETEKEAEKLLPQLKNFFEKTKKEYETGIYQGRKGIRFILKDILKEKEYFVFGSNEKFPEIMQHDFDIFQKNKKELKIKSKTIMSISMKNKKILKEAFTKYKFIPEEYSLPTSTFIYGNKVAIITWTEIPLGTLIKNKEVADSFKKYFDALWKKPRP